MARAIRFSTSAHSNTTQRGTFQISTRNSGMGKSATIGFYSMIDPPAGGYTFYQHKANNGPSIILCQDDQELLTVVNAHGHNFTTVSDVLLAAQSGAETFTVVTSNESTSIDNGGWTRFWWYDGTTGLGWPEQETETLGYAYGHANPASHYGFQRLPSGLQKENTELLAIDGSGNIYKWDFNSSSTTSHRVWNSMTLGTEGRWGNQGTWNPTVIAGSFFNTNQDSWQYREEHGVKSFLLDDDTCDCKSTLNAGHAMCGSGWNQTYAQPEGAEWRYGVDTLNDGGCLGPIPTRKLELFFRSR